MYRLRFNLSNNEHFGKWQLKNRDEISYYHPEEVTIRAYNVTLKNRPSTAEQIFAGANKTVCAWLDCEFIDISPVEKIETEQLTQLSFNPRIFPHWTIPSSPSWNLDNKYVSEIFTIWKAVFTTTPPYSIIGSLGNPLKPLNSF